MEMDKGDSTESWQPAERIYYVAVPMKERCGE